MFCSCSERSNTCMQQELMIATDDALNDVFHGHGHANPRRVFFRFAAKVPSIV